MKYSLNQNIRSTNYSMKYSIDELLIEFKIQYLANVKFFKAKTPATTHRIENDDPFIALFIQCTPW